VYGRGRAYRFGGDEYVVLLPNAEVELASGILLDWQRRLKVVPYATSITRRPTVSCGLLVLTPNSRYTLREVEDIANRAKGLAKQAGKARVAVYREPFPIGSEPERLMA
jgi:diguanylate cyclase (GGDEF)-like protein